MVKEKFGSVDVDLHGSNYLRNFSCINLGINIRNYIKIFKGFSVNANQNLEMP